MDTIYTRQNDTGQKTRISRDLGKEDRFSRFLERVVFPKLRDERVYIDRVFNRTLDMRGVDATVNGYLVDIKAHELREGFEPRKFSFERQTRNRFGDDYRAVSDVVDGWLVSRKKITEKYLICYYTQTADRRIKSCTLVLIDREAIINALKDRGINVTAPVTDLCSSATRAVMLENGSIKYYFPGVTDVSLTHSLQLPEEPLNVIVDYDTIQELCDWSRTFDMEVPCKW